MKIAVHSGQLDQEIPGGIGKYTRDLATGLAEADVEVVTFGSKYIPADTHLHQTRTMPQLVQYFLWNNLGISRPRIQADVVHFPSLAIAPGVQKFVVTVHDLSFKHLSRRGRNFHERGLKRARKADAIVTPSDFVRDELIALGFEEEKVFSIHHGIEPPRISHASLPAPLQGKPYVLAVGTIEPKKRLDIIAEAIKKVRLREPEVVLAVAGPTGWGNFPALDESYVVKLGQLNSSTLDTVYRNAICTAMMSPQEGFGYPALESMARGTPVVAANGGALPEVVGTSGFLVNNADELAGSILLLTGHSGTRSEMSVASVTRASTFSMDEFTRRHIAVYEKVVG